MRRASRNKGGNGNNGAKWVRPQTRHRIYLRDGYACVYCGAADRLCLDHLVPRTMGGTNAPANLVTSCIPCNSRRQHRNLRSWYVVLRLGGTDTTPMRRRIRRLVRKVLPR